MRRKSKLGIYTKCSR